MHNAPALICPRCHYEGLERICVRCNTYMVNQKALSDAPDDYWLGRILAGRYVILQRLGVGGMGAVYRARDELTDRPLAIKFLLKQYANHPSVRARFEAEAAATLAVNHPNVVRLIDFGHEADGTLWLAMEFVRGWTLRDEVNRNGAFTIEQAIRLCRQLLSALAAAHAVCLIHRDLKHDNIMFSGSRERFTVRILDFGIVKNNAYTAQTIKNDLLLEESEGSIDQAPLPHNLTSVGVLVGSPSYMSPEQVRGLDVQPPADLYSLGVVLYEILTGRRLFSANDYASLLRDGARRDVPPLYFTALGEPVPAEFNRILQRCLELDPKDRFPDANTMLLALNQLSPQSEASLPTDLFADPPQKIEMLDDSENEYAFTTLPPDAESPISSSPSSGDELFCDSGAPAEPGELPKPIPGFIAPLIGAAVAIVVFLTLLGVWCFLPRLMSE